MVAPIYFCRTVSKRPCKRVNPFESAGVKLGELDPLSQPKRALGVSARMSGL
jgi:hypothetical protein